MVKLSNLFFNQYSNDHQNCDCTQMRNNDAIKWSLYSPTLPNVVGNNPNVPRTSG